MGRASETEGRKDDAGKPAMDLLPTDAITEIAKVLEFGRQKYSARNWEKGMRWGRPYAAGFRHLLKWWGGEELDPETGLHHLAHAGCCVLFLLSYVIRRGRHLDNDDRFNTEVQR